MTKNKIRKEVFSSLKALAGREERSRALQEKFLSLPQVTGAFSVALFMSMPTEPDTSGCIAALQKMGKRVFVPRVCGEEMVFVEITEKTEFVPGAFGVSEPVGKPYEGPFDVIAVPLVAADEKGNRLGHGKGYYDKYLKKNPAFSVGLAFIEQKREVPSDPWDVRLNTVLFC